MYFALLTLFLLLTEVITFRKDPNSRAIVNYTARFAFGLPRMDERNLVSTSAWKEMQMGQSVDIIDDSGGDSDFSYPSSAGGNLIHCRNKTPEYQRISLGFISHSGQNYEPALVWKNVGSGMSIDAKLDAKLKIYATSDYRETELIRGEVESPLLWEGDIAHFQNTSKFVLRINQNTGEITLRLEDN